MEIIESIHQDMNCPNCKGHKVYKDYFNGWIISLRYRDPVAGAPYCRTCGYRLSLKEWNKFIAEKRKDLKKVSE